MKKKNKELTPTERLKSLKRVKNGLFLGEIGCCVAPLGILTAINFKEYFIELPAWRTSLSFIMLAAITLLSVSIVAKDKLKINLFGALAGLAVIDGFLWLLGALINELAYILLYVIVGFVAAFILELKKRGETKAIEELEEGIKKAKTDIIAEQYKKEQEKIKVVIKD